MRFMNGSENDVEYARAFADTLFRLLRAGARSIFGAHHSPKGFEGQEVMVLENIVRGSGDLGAMVCAVWGLRQIDAERNRIYVQNVKPRDFQPCAPFVIEGRPHLDNTGHFKMLEPPGTAEELKIYLRNKGGRPSMSDKDAKIEQALALRAEGKSLRDIGKILGVSHTQVDRWLFEHDSSVTKPCDSFVTQPRKRDGETAIKSGFPPS